MSKEFSQNYFQALNQVKQQCALLKRSLDNICDVFEEHYLATTNGQSTGSNLSNDHYDVNSSITTNQNLSITELSNGETTNSETSRPAKRQKLELPFSKTSPSSKLSSCKSMNDVSNESDQHFDDLSNTLNNDEPNNIIDHDQTASGNSKLIEAIKKYLLANPSPCLFKCPFQECSSQSAIFENEYVYYIFLVNNIFFVHRDSRAWL